MKKTQRNKEINKTGNRVRDIEREREGQGQGGRENKKDKNTKKT